MGNFWGIAFGLMFIVFGIGSIAGINLWRFFFPILLILFGFSILSNQLRENTSWRNMGTVQETHEKTLNYEAVFSGSNKRVVTSDFRGGKVTAVFGGTELDLRKAKIASDSAVKLEVSAVFGGVKIIVPKTWSVQGNLTGVFGGFGNSAVNPSKPEGTLIIKGSSVFGGGEIVN